MAMESSAFQRAQRHVLQMGCLAPMRLELGTGGKNGEDRQLSQSVDEKPDQLLRRRIDPMQILHHHQHGTARRRTLPAGAAAAWKS